MLTVISYSLNQGRRSYAPVLLGVVLGDVTALSISVFILGLVESSPLWLRIAYFFSGILLLYYGVIRLLGKAGKVDTSFQARSKWKLFWSTYLVSGLNPKSIPLFCFLLGSYFVTNVDVSQQRLILSLTFLALSLSIAALYMSFAAKAKQFTSTRHAKYAFQIAAGVLLSTAGVWALRTALSQCY